MNPGRRNHVGCLGVVVGMILGEGWAKAGSWPSLADHVAQRLTSPQRAERQGAIRDLAELPAAVAAPIVRRALDHPEKEVRLAAAAEALSRRVVGVEERVVGWLNDPDVRVRTAACQLLQPDPPTTAAAGLGRALGDGDAGVRQAAARALGHVPAAPGVDAIGPLLGHLDDSSVEVRKTTIDALGRLDDPRAVAPLTSKIQDGASDVRRAVIRALGDLGDPRAVTALLGALRDGNPDVRRDALDALSEVTVPGESSTEENTKGSEAILGFAVAPLTDARQPPAVRRAAWKALVRAGGERGLMAVLESLTERDAAEVPFVRAVLGQAGPRAVPWLLPALAANPSEQTASVVLDALAMLRARSAIGPVVDGLRKGALPPVPALRCLGSLGDPTTLPLVLEFLSHRDSTVRAAARAAVETQLDPEHPDSRAVEPIAVLLRRATLPDEERSSLLRLLGRTGSSRAESDIAPFVAPSFSLPLRLAAVDALGVLPNSVSVRETLLAALQADSAVVRSHAASSLARSGTDATVMALLTAFSAADEPDRAAFATALAGAVSRVRVPAVVTRLRDTLATADGPLRDALLEGLSRSPSPEAHRLVTDVASSAVIADRRKVAELLSAEGDQSWLVNLTRDDDAGIRANAVWSLGAHGRLAHMNVVTRLLGDRDSAVAANAALALGRLGARSRSSPDVVTAVRSLLCAAFANSRPYVRAASLAGLRVLGTRCDGEGEPERRLLTLDPSEIVRAAAADLVVAVPRSGDRRALRRCRREDPFAAVVDRCAASPWVREKTVPVTVFLVADRSPIASPEAPYALTFADHSFRHGVADRRGAVFEPAAPLGLIALGVPGGSWR